MLKHACVDDAKFQERAQRFSQNSNPHSTVLNITPSHRTRFLCVFFASLHLCIFTPRASVFTSILTTILLLTTAFVFVISFRILSIARAERQLATLPVACTALPLPTCAGVDLHVPVSMDPPPTRSMSLEHVDVVMSLALEREDSIAMLVEISARLRSFLCVLPKMVP